MIYRAEACVKDRQTSPSLHDDTIARSLQVIGARRTLLIVRDRSNYL
jgi:hypothetical protein